MARQRGPTQGDRELLRRIVERAERETGFEDPVHDLATARRDRDDLIRLLQEAWGALEAKP